MAIKKESIAATNVTSNSSYKKARVIMKRSSLEKYFLSIVPVKLMLEKGVITKQEYLRAESFLADKYCIKNGHLYRQNNLTIPRSQVIDMVPEEEVYDNGEDNFQARRVTKIGTEN